MNLPGMGGGLLENVLDGFTACFERAARHQVSAFEYLGRRKPPCGFV
jgi:hypothetical protein